MSEKSVHIPAVTCGHCLMRIKRDVGEVKGVLEVGGSPETQIISFRWEAPATWEAIRGVLADIGYPPLE